MKAKEKYRKNLGCLTLWSWNLHFMMFAIKVITVICLHLLTIRGIVGNPDAKRLYDDLLSNYNRLIRPVSNSTQTVLVKLGLRLSQLIDLVSLDSDWTEMLFFLIHFVVTFIWFQNYLFFIKEFKGSNSHNERMAWARKYFFSIRKLLIQNERWVR